MGQPLSRAPWGWLLAACLARPSLLQYRNQAKRLGNVQLFVVRRGESEESQMLLWTGSQEKGAGRLAGLVESQPLSGA